jgi:hypothetical protein
MYICIYIYITIKNYIETNAEQYTTVKEEERNKQECCRVYLCENILAKNIPTQVLKPKDVLYTADRNQVLFPAAEQSRPGPVVGSAEVEKGEQMQGMMHRRAGGTRHHTLVVEKVRGRWAVSKHITRTDFVRRDSVSRN